MFDSFMEVLDAGILTIPFHFEEPLTVLLYWIFFAVIAIIEILVIRGAKSRVAGWILPAISAVLVLICDIAIRLVTGWDMLPPLFGYGFFLTLLAASLVGMLICRLRKRHNPSSQE